MRAVYGPGPAFELMLRRPTRPAPSAQTGRDFGERERFLLQLLRPHIADAYRGAVRTHLNNIFTRLEVGSRTAAASVGG
jgi:hypothetical protein